MLRPRTSPGKINLQKAIFCLMMMVILPLSQVSTSTVLKAEETAERPAVALIYDLSKSMWAKIDDKIKITLAQQSIAATLNDYDRKIDLGILAFGHVAKKGCNNVEEITKYGRLDAETAVKAIDPLRPRGSAPIGQALLDAANLAPDRAKPFTVILLSDGESNCPINPCETALSLKGAHPGLVIDVIGIGTPNSPQINPLSCIIEPSNGKLTYASNQQEIELALKASIERAKTRKPILSNAETAATDDLDKDGWAGATEIIVEPKKDQITGAVGEDDKPKNKFESNNLKVNKTHGGLALVAHLIDKGPEINSGLVWRIYEEKPNRVTGKHKLISAHRTPDPVMSLKAGIYLINCAYGRSFLTKKVKIEQGKNATERFILNAGGLRISSVLANGNPVPDNTVLYDILSDERDQFGKRIKIISNVRPGVVVRLNAAIYHIVSTYGDANARSEADVSIIAGKLTEATINHKAAKVTFKLVYQKGGEALADTKWSLLSPTGNVIKKSAGALPTHILAAGNYTILAERGKEKYSHHFEVSAGETSQVEVIIQ